MEDFFKFMMFVGVSSGCVILVGAIISYENGVLEECYLGNQEACEEQDTNPDEAFKTLSENKDEGHMNELKLKKEGKESEAINVSGDCEKQNELCIKKCDEESYYPEDCYKWCDDDKKYCEEKESQEF